MTDGDAFIDACGAARQLPAPAGASTAHDGIDGCPNRTFRVNYRQAIAGQMAEITRARCDRREGARACAAGPRNP